MEIVCSHHRSWFGLARGEYELIGMGCSQNRFWFGLVRSGIGTSTDVLLPPCSGLGLVRIVACEWKKMTLLIMKNCNVKRTTWPYL